MEQRTCNIIMCCKGYGEGKTYQDKIINYMSKECGLEAKYYNQETIFSILQNAVYDYLDTTQQTYEFISNILDSIRHYFYSPILKDKNFTPADAIIEGFHMVHIRKYNKQTRQHEIINGFTQEMLNKADLILTGGQNIEEL